MSKAEIFTVITPCVALIVFLATFDMWLGPGHKDTPQAHVGGTRFDMFIMFLVTVLIVSFAGSWFIWNAQ